MTRVLAVLFAALGAAAPALAQPAPPSSAAQPAIFLVRHAERADTAGGGAPMMASDPDLSAAGRARAESLARILEQAGIAAIYTTEYKRTKQTAEPLARALGLQPVAVAAKDLPGLVQKLKGAPGNVLVVGHSNSVPDVIKALGVAEPVQIGDADYDNLFVVTPGSPPGLLRLLYR
jgi:phosphohistidine phosphatase SixA